MLFKPLRTRSKSYPAKSPPAPPTADDDPPIDLLPQWPRFACRNRVQAPPPGMQKAKKVRNMKRGSWSKQEMDAAVEEVEEGYSSIRKVARKHGIPHTTLRNWLFNISKVKNGRKPKALSTKEEEDLVTWCLQMAAEGTGVTVGMLRERVAEICAGRPTPFTDGIPGMKWWKCFKGRHPDLSLRRAQIVDNARAIAISPSNLDAFYSDLAEAYHTFGFDASHIWNCDESGVQAGKESGLRVISRKGAKQISERTMKNREWLTVLCCVSASGNKLPSLYILKGQRAREHYLDGCEPDAAMAMQKRAWITNDLFKSWIDHFKSNVPGGVSVENPHLLILDGHGSHLQVETIRYASSLGIQILKLPAHTSHRLQPLDVACFRPFKEAFRNSRKKFSLHKKGVEPAKEDLTALVCDALEHALTPNNIVAGFKKTGIWPLDPAKVVPELGGRDFEFQENRNDTPLDQLANVVEEVSENVQENVNRNEAQQQDLHVHSRARGRTFVPKDIKGTLLVTKADIIARLEQEEIEKKERKKAREEATKQKKAAMDEKKKLREEKLKEKEERKKERELAREHKRKEMELAREQKKKEKEERQAKGKKRRKDSEIFDLLNLQKHVRFLLLHHYKPVFACKCISSFSAAIIWP